jgi:anaerobic selenocysteine-containing dehydrogenase
VEAVVVYNSNPVAVAPDSAQVVRGFAREDLFTVVLEHFMTDTADHADYVLPATTQLEHWDAHRAYGHTWAMLNKPAIAPVGQARSNAEIFRALAARLGFDEPCFADSDEAMARQVSSHRTSTRRRWTSRAGAACRCRSAVCRGRFSITQRPRDGRPTGPGCGRLCAQLRIVPSRHRPGRALPAGHDLATGAALSQQQFCQRGQPARHRTRTPGGDAPARRATRGISDGATVRVFNDRGEYVAKAAVCERARPGVVNGLGIWWRKMGLNGTNVNELTHQQLTDIGRGPSFYDCLVEVAAV